MTYRVIWRKKKYYTNPYTIVDFSLEEMRPQVEKEYEHWFVTRALMPHDYTNTHLILWPKDAAKILPDLSATAQMELMYILQERYDANYTVYRNCPDDVTVPIKLHFHIVQFKNIVDLMVHDGDYKPLKADISA